PSLLASVTLDALGLNATEGRPPAETLVQHLRQRELLLVLDNFEQIVEAAPTVAGLLGDCPKLRAIVTSRIVLRVRGETEYPVNPLAVSSVTAETELESIAPCDAVELFVDRAREARHGFDLTRDNR